MKISSAQTKDFHFKKFSVTGGNAGMPVSTDGVILGAWAALENAQTVLDIGTGTGLLALMSAQRNPDARITALDIDHDAWQTASANFAASPWADRLGARHQDLLDWGEEARFDHIICNPPYFTSGETAQAQHRAQARHVITLTHASLLKRCWQHLHTHGRASFILPLTEGEQFIVLAEKQGFYLTRRLDVRTTAKKPVSRVLLELAKQPAECQPEELLIHHDGGYSEQFIALTCEFYLKM